MQFPLEATRRVRKGLETKFIFTAFLAHIGQKVRDSRYLWFLLLIHPLYRSLDLL